MKAGARVGRYRLLSPLTKGGSVEVWAAFEAERAGPPRGVALKILSLDRERPEDAPYQEAQAAASLIHPNLCRTLELGNEQGHVFLATEWIHGVSLGTLQSQLAPAKRFDFAVAAHFIANVCGGLHAAHELRRAPPAPNGVVHRHITPDKILVSVEGDVKLIDLGLFGLRNKPPEATEAEVMNGELGYLTPEQLAGRHVDPRTDIYLLGCTLYALSTGAQPFASPDAARTLLHISEGKHRPPSTHVDRYPKRLEAIVSRAMAVDPERRFRSADEMRVSLEAFIDEQGEPVAREAVALLVTAHAGKLVEARRAELTAAYEQLTAKPGAAPPQIPAMSNSPPSVARAGRPQAPPLNMTQKLPRAPGEPLEPRPQPELPPRPARRVAEIQLPTAPEASAVSARSPDIRGCLVATREGTLLSEHGQLSSASKVLTLSVSLTSELEQAGALLGLGLLSMVALKTPNVVVSVAPRPPGLLVAEADPTRPLKNVEFALQAVEWPEASVPALRPDATRSVEQVTKAEEGAAASNRAPNKPTAGLAPRPPVPPAPPAGRHSLAEEWVLLRRSLVKGQLTAARQAATRVGAIPLFRPTAAGSADTVQGLPTLLEAISAILAGDDQAGLKKLDVLQETVQVGPSLKWAAQVWSARASANAGDGLEAARVYAESSLRLAERLDTEALGVSTFAVAQVAYQARDWGAALRLARAARELIAPLKHPHELAACWLLEARSLLAQGRDEEGLQAAQSAKDSRASWPPPVTLLVRRALGDQRLSDAEQALDALLDKRPVPPEAARDRRLIEHVRSGVLPSSTACDYLDLLDAPASPETIRSLHELATKFPRIAQFRETLGWRLLRSGRPDAAKVVFERLGARGDLPDDLRASVLLGLGLLATSENASQAPSVKLKAAVNVGIKYDSVRPPAKGEPAVAERGDGNDALPPRPREQTGARPIQREATAEARRPAVKTAPSSVFSGSLELFALPDLLEFLRSGQRSGSLVCSSAAGIGAVHLKGGKVTGAAIPGGKPNAEYLDAVMARGNADLPPTPEQIREAQRNQIMAALAELITWNQGQFAFNAETEVQASSSEIGVELDSQWLLLELFRGMDEQTRRPG